MFVKLAIPMMVMAEKGFYLKAAGGILEGEEIIIDHKIRVVTPVQEKLIEDMDGAKDAVKKSLEKVGITTRGNSDRS